MGIYCPKCNIEHKQLIANANTLPAIAPFYCLHCGAILLWIDRTLRVPTEQELYEIKKSIAYRDFILPAQRIRQALLN